MTEPRKVVVQEDPWTWIDWLEMALSVHHAVLFVVGWGVASADRQVTHALLSLLWLAVLIYRRRAESDHG